MTLTTDANSPKDEFSLKLKDEHLFPIINSYGGKSLQTNLKAADETIAKLNYTNKIWNKSGSQWMLKHLTCSQADGWLRLRQIGAEVSQKRKALNEAKFNYLKKEAEINIKREDLLDASPAKSKLLEIEILELEYQTSEILGAVEGALKEVQTYSGMHDTLVETLGELTEEEFEKAQTKGHIKRAMQQSIREVRECGRIKTGNQEYLEQVGVSVGYALTLIEEFLSQEKELKVMNTSLLYDFLDKVAEELEPVADLQLEIFGFDKDTDLSLTHTPEKDTD